MMLEVESLHKIYRKGPNEVHSLRGLDLKVEKGELIFIVGPSGSGKSTLLHILGALDRPTRGTVRLDGEDIFTRSDRDLALLRRKKFGFVFQSFNLISTLTALDNVLCPLIPGGITAPRREAAESLLTRIGLGERLHHKPFELSGGEQQRVALARALINTPEIVFADEPTGELDSRKGAEIIDMIRRLNREMGVTVLIVTHAVQNIRDDDKVFHLLDGNIDPAA
ncbi:MAG: ABC transporter ATP-binding protein [Planctomycetota bacterium]|jgi:putative ABC transport system ATP-binding protein